MIQIHYQRQIDICMVAITVADNILDNVKIHIRSTLLIKLKTIDRFFKIKTLYSIIH